MDFQTVFIESVEICEFKKIKDLTICPDRGANLLFGSFRSGKTSVCEFLQFVLYGADSVALARGNAENARGKILLTADDRSLSVERSVIEGVETLSFTDSATGLPVETDLTPGEYLTGLNQESFDLITYFRQARYSRPASRPQHSFFVTVAGFEEETAGIYEKFQSVEEEIERFRNAEGNGSLDRLLQEQKLLQTQLDSRPVFEEEVRSCEQSLEDIRIRLDENERRCVLLKADMAGHTDEMQLSRNKESAEELKIKIQAEEKKLRLMKYDLEHKIGKLSPEELEEMKSDYSRLSLSVAALSEARAALTAAEENLSFHEKLFTGNETVSHYTKEQKRIQKNKALRMTLQILGVILLALGAVMGFVLHAEEVSLPVSISVSVAIAVLGIALLSSSSAFTVKIRKILAENNRSSVKDFNEFFDRLRAHAKTTQVYRDQVTSERTRCRRKSRDKEVVQSKLSAKVAALGYKEDGELPAICDDLIEANDAYYDLQATLEEDRAEYQRILSTNVEGTELTVSAEFRALQSELAFLTAQNDSLYKKKVLLTSRLSAAKAELEKDPEGVRLQLQKTEETLRSEEEAFRLLSEKKQGLLLCKEQFEKAVKQTLEESINQKLAFMLKEGESFLFDDSFELCFRDQTSVLPLIGAGGGMVSEMGLLAFRLSLSEMLKKNHLPMIFDDTLAMLSADDALALFRVLQKTCSQFFVSTSSQSVADLCRDSARTVAL